ncbi:type I methionyl aminopeptidase [bacterium]|nr:type I methionyl aminopeptidase [bacterium]
MSKTKGGVILKTANEIELIREGGRLLRQCLNLVREAAVERVRTKDLDQIAYDFIVAQGGRPAFKGYRGFPATLCISVNEEVVHGIPNNRRLKAGDVVSVDCGLAWQGFIADSAITIAVGEVAPNHQKLMKITEESLYLGIAQAKVGNYVQDISRAVQEHCESHGFSVVRDLVGHGVGRDLHEEPQVPNFVSKDKGAKLEAGMVIAIEPMVNTGTFEVVSKRDGWTIVTVDKGYSAHYEHTVAITANGPLILTDGK